MAAPPDTPGGELAGLYGEFLDESQELLEALGRDLVELERRPDDAEVVQRIFRAAHSLKGNAGFMGLEELAALAHAMENVLGALRDGSLAGTSALLDLLFRGLDACRALLAASAAETASRPVDLDELLGRLDGLLKDRRPAAGGPDTPEQAGAPGRPVASERSGAPERLDAPEQPGSAAWPDAPGRPGASRPEAASAAVSKATAVDAAPEPAPTAEGARRDGDTIRVSTARLDRLVNLVGELTATRSRLAALSRSRKDRALEEVAGSLSTLADQLQDEVLSIRMVPIRTLFQKFHRLVRDAAREAGKEVVLELSGESTELDKAIVEVIQDPVVHLVRNAVGHGLEPPEMRRRAGKPPAGRVRLAARHAQDHVVIEIADDGRGLEEATIRRRAVEVGLIPASEADTPLGPEAIRRLIFSPGFSTASQVDRLSGRGVGLDVVRTRIEGLGGGVEVESRPGAGATFTLRVPLTLAMLQIFLVRVAGRLYGLPLAYIDETIRVREGELEAVGRQRIHLLRGRAVPIVPLADPFAITGAAGPPASPAAGPDHSAPVTLSSPQPGERRSVEPGEAGSTPLHGDAPRPVVIVRHGDRRVGFLVDELCGKDKTVLKPLGPYLARLPQPLRGIAGASLLGSGEIVLIVDVPGLFALAVDAVAA